MIFIRSIYESHSIPHCTGPLLTWDSWNKYNKTFSLFSNYCPGVASSAGVDFITSSPFRKTNKQHIKQRDLKCHRSVCYVFTLSFEIKYPHDCSLQFEFLTQYQAFAVFRNSPLNDLCRIAWILSLIILTLSWSLTYDPMLMIS